MFRKVLLAAVRGLLQTFTERSACWDSFDAESMPLCMCFDCASFLHLEEALKSPKSVSTYGQSPQPWLISQLSPDHFVESHWPPIPNSYPSTLLSLSYIVTLQATASSNRAWSGHILETIEYLLIRALFMDRATDSSKLHRYHRSFLRA